MAMALPLCVLYEGCIVIGRLRDRTRRRAVAADPLAQLGDDETSYLDMTPSYVDNRPSSL
jgi:Sec-independent protein secretion pathway component TatC